MGNGTAISAVVTVKFLNKILSVFHKPGEHLRKGFSRVIVTTRVISTREMTASAYLWPTSWDISTVSIPDTLDFRDTHLLVGGVSFNSGNLQKGPIVKSILTTLSCSYFVLYRHSKEKGIGDCDRT